MSKINLTTVRIFGEKYAVDTFLVILFGPLMASGMIDAWRFCKTVAVSIPVISIFLWRYWQEMVSFREQTNSYLELNKAA